MLKLTYLVTLYDGVAAEALVDDIAYAFGGIEVFLGTARVEPSRELVSFAAVSSSTLVAEIQLTERQIDFGGGGMALIASLLFGNPFRGKGIRSAKLTSLTFGGEELQFGAGPVLGLAGLRSLVGSDSFPLLSVPLRHQWSEGRANVLSELSRAGVSCFVESALSVLQISQVRARIDEMVSLAEQCGRPLVYIVNGTIRLSRLQDTVALLVQASRSNLCTAIRVCPISVGLGCCEWLRTSGVPLLGYNSFYKALSNGEALTIGAAPLAKIFRIVGCDLISVGLQASEMLGEAAATEIVDSCLRISMDSVKQSCPMFTGGITPRVAYAICRKFGGDLILHTGGPIFRATTDLKLLKRNVTAIREAAEFAKGGLAPEAAFREETAATRAWRSYERDYGSA